MSIIANKHKRTGWLINKTQGFTLIEVLIAMLVLAGGLLGLAALQTYTLRSNLAAYNRGQATQLLYDMSDRIRANNCIANPNSNPPVTCPTTTYTINNTETATTDTCTTCTPDKLAKKDLFEWHKVIAATLPMGRGCIVNNAGIFNLYITWDDDRSGTVTTDVKVPDGCAASFSTFTAPVSGISHDPVFTMSLRP